MKNLKKSCLLLLICLQQFFNVNAQDVIRNKPCSDSMVTKHLDSIKALMTPKGFKVVRESSLNMENEYEMPIIVPLNQLQWYFIVFIGSADSKLLEVRMYDWEERQVAYKRSKNDGIEDGNGRNISVIAYDYFPKGSEYHMIKPVQVNKKRKKDICGHILLMKKVEESEEEKKKKEEKPAATADDKGSDQ